MTTNTEPDEGGAQSDVLTPPPAQVAASAAPAALGATESASGSPDAWGVLSEAERVLLAEAGRLSGAATEGPWRECDHWSTLGHYAIVWRDDDPIADGVGTAPDAAFVAWSRTGIPALLALVDRLAAEVERLRSLVADAERDLGAVLDQRDAARDELDKYLTLSPQACPQGLHAEWLVDSEHTCACPWCERDAARSTAALLEADGARLRERITSFDHDPNTDVEEPVRSLFRQVREQHSPATEGGEGDE